MSAQDGIAVDSDRCPICKKPDVRRLVELGWNARMDAHAIAGAFSGFPNAAAVRKHINEHTPGGRNLPVENAIPLRERALAIQRIQIDEIERRMERAQEWAAFAREHGNESADWSEAFDILGKDMQAAVASILRAVSLEDRKEAKTADLKLGLFELMMGGKGGGGMLAPVGLVESGEVIEGEVVE